MTTASPHSRQRHPRHPATEAGLWLVWITARITGAAALTRSIRRRLRALPVDALADAAGIAVAWSGRHVYTAYTRVRGLIHRAIIRVELVAADLLTRPARLVDVTATRRPGRGWAVLLGAVLAAGLYLALR